MSAFVSTEPDVPSLTLSTWSDNMPAVGTASVDTMQPQAFTMPEFNSIEPASQSTVDFWYDPGFYSAALMVPSGSGMLPDVTGPPPAPDFQSFEFTPFELHSFFGVDSGFNAGIPSATPADILFATSFQYLSSDTSFDFFSLQSASSFPLLPPPQPESPSECSPVIRPQIWPLPVQQKHGAHDRKLTRQIFSHPGVPELQRRESGMRRKKNQSSPKRSLGRVKLDFEIVRWQIFSG
ncbi:hypothetical protein B0H10DRAFT_1178285 [Mycena sp. CBHHK59/15]|nr:hypothetical protein B0H10DRAFT_1178285 [Mycena sp. CBHHK59/15]